MTEKGLKVNVKKTRVFCTGKRTVGIEFPVQYVEEELEETPFYALNVTVGCMKDALAWENAHLMQ